MKSQLRVLAAPWKQMVAFTILSTLVATACDESGVEQSPLRFAISFPEERSAEPLDGRVLLYVSNDDSAEPRFQISNGPGTQLVFGVDADGLRPSEETIVDAAVFGYPLESISDIPPGEYWVQALLNRYETYHLGDGRVLKLPPDKGEGQHLERKPGNFYSTPQRIRIDPRRDATIRISMDMEIPPIEPPEDTKYVKHIRMQSKLLTEFWGRPMYLGAHVLLPEGFDDYPEARYPLAIFHGHFPDDFSGFREVPPDPNLPNDYNARFDLYGYSRIVQEHAYQFYQEWTGPNFPRMLIIEIQHPTQYFDDSYAVNSVNMGPYGDAITHELIPYIEEQFRGIGEGWAD